MKVKGKRMNKIDVVKKAIEFNNPPYLPIELLDVPGVYSAYFTQNPDEVEFIPGSEDFDMLWAGYSWSLTELYKNDVGEAVRKDEWGVLYKVPSDTSTAYVFLEHPLRGKDSLSGYEFPDPRVAQPFFNNLKKVIDTRYSDRFINGYIDPSPFLVAFANMGYDELLIKLIDNLAMIKELIRRIFEYQKEIVRYFKEIGTHMITVLDEIAGVNGLMFSPELFRKEFLPYYKDFCSFIHDQDMYSCIMLDGDITAILDDIMSLGTDSVQFLEPHIVGIETIAEHFRGKRCIRACIDMRETLPSGTPTEIEAEASKMVKFFNTDKGGFIPTIIRWHRPEYPEDNVAASVRAFNKYRNI
jgi:uroporphyrinogen decarboxylase